LKKDIDLKVRLGDDDPTVMGDEKAIRQILLNLLTNAVKFTSPGGTVSYSSTVVPGLSVDITITDTGIGIAADDLVKVMQPFGQVFSADIRNEEGTGLGLPLSKKLTELQGATFDLKSEAGSGTTVRLTFQLHVP
jgi:signal transduction histidine kinase